MKQAPHFIATDLDEWWITVCFTRLEAYLARYAEFVRLYGT